MSSFFVKQLIVSGNGKTESVLNFCSGINIMHGKSDSGKTMAANCIAYAMGGSLLPFSSEVTNGYDTVTIVLETSSNSEIRLSRKIAEEKVDVESDLPEIPSGCYSTDAAAKKALNNVLLYLIGLDYTPMIGKNVNSAKVRFTWKNLMRALYLDKETMGRSDYVIMPKNSYEQTPFLSILLFLMYGQDFSEKDPQTKATIRKAQYEAKMSYVLQKKKEFTEKKDKADEILKALPENKNGIDEYTQQLRLVENEIEQTIEASKEYYYEILELEEQIKEQQVVIERYESLKSQYVADVKRLNCIVEGESLLINVPEANKCPFCDNEIPKHKQVYHTQIAANELQRIVSLLDGLEKTEREAKRKLKGLETSLENLRNDKKNCDEGIEKGLKPLASSIRHIISSYQESVLAEQNLRLYAEMLEELEQDRLNLEQEEKDGKKDAKNVQYKPKEYFKDDFIDSMTSYIREILKSCHYPKHSKAAFDLKSFDIQVDGIDKALIHGQGYCSLFNSVLFLAFRRCFFEKASYKPDFLMIDTPLLGLVERVGEPDPQEQKNYLYKYMAEHSQEGQVIIMDNANELPDFLYDSENVSVIEFSEREGNGFLIDYNRGTK